MSNYDSSVRNKTAEEILATVNSEYGDVGTYLRVAAQVRSTQELITSLERASASSERMAKRSVYLTVGLVAVGTIQALATGWPLFSWWILNGFRFK